ncbi:ACP S-malonyltransferase [Actinopolymorpha pittospori]|nr:acyltransferase domain-containing protein [Actinopolymorpha pittospori]
MVDFVLVIVAPGQGAQTPGFLAPWLEDPAFADRINWLSAVSDVDLAHYGTKADAETIRDTAIAQPLLVASGLVAALALFPHPAGDAFRVIDLAAGHSVGEITAAAGVGVISAEQAMVFVRQRGKAMAEAAAKNPTGMMAVLGGHPEEVLAAIERHNLIAANNNGPGQVVAAGTLADLERFTADPPAKARLVPLQVAGAFHTHYVAHAVDLLGGYARAISTHDPRTRLLSNRDGHIVHNGREVLDRIVTQVSSPVRWDLCMQTMQDLGVTGMLEMPPAGTLTGIARRAMPGVETFALKTPDQLDDARAFVEKHGEGGPLEGNPTWRLLVSPMKGIFNLATDQPTGAALAPGDVVGNVKSLRDDLQVSAPHGGTIVEWLVEDGDPVSPGQPLVRLHPAVSVQ